MDNRFWNRIANGVLFLALGTSITYGQTSHKGDAPGRPVTEKEKYSEFSKEVRGKLLDLDKEIVRLSKLDDIDFHKVAYNYALRDKDGLQEGFDASKSFADELVKQKQGDRARHIVLHRLAYNYALREKDGLQEGFETARKFADAHATRSNGHVLIELHRQAYNYALRDTRGLQLGFADALAFAQRVYTRPNALEILSLHKRAYNYALRDSDGLQLGFAEAMAYANRAAGLAE